MSRHSLGIDRLLLLRSPGPPVAAARIVMPPVSAGVLLLHTWAAVTVLAIVTGSMLAGLIGWTTFIADRSDRKRKSLEGAFPLRQEHVDQLVEAVEEPETEARLRRLVKAGVAGAVLLIGLLGLLSWSMALQAAEDADWVAHTHEVSATLELTLRHLVDVETGARGFALTGHEPFLEPYAAGKYSLGLDLQALRTLVVDPDQVRRLDMLVKQAEFRLEEGADLVAARRQSGETPAIARLTQDKQVMDTVRKTVQEMEDQEKLLLAQRTQHARGTRRFTSSAIGLSSILGIVFLSIAGLTVNREIRVAARAQAQVKALNADLEQRVAQRTAALEAEAAARLDSESRLAAVIKSALDPIITVNDELRIVLFNQAAEKMFDCSRSDAMGQSIKGFIPDMGRVAESGFTNQTLGLQDGLWAVRADGGKFQIEASISENEIAGHQMFTIILRDITRRKADEMEIRKLNEDLEDKIAKRTHQLEATNRELEAFSYSVSHDLRAPLRHIAGFARILTNDFGPVMAVEARDYLQLIEDAVRRMGLLVEGLLSLAKLGKQSLKLCVTELNAVVDNVISILRPESEGRDVEWRIAKLPALDCDPVLMAQVFQNLLGNALKYSRGRGKAVIEVDSIQRPGKPIIIFVRDNGAGFNRKHADRLFGVFQRFHTASEFEGTGVGLATVHGIIQKHGGTIWAESEPDHGATFYFALQKTEQIAATPKVAADL